LTANILLVGILHYQHQLESKDFYLLAHKKEDQGSQTRDTSATAFAWNVEDQLGI
jgi:hypothetical protein